MIEILTRLRDKSMKNNTVKKCEFCNKQFTIQYKDKKFCSVECYRGHQRSGNYKIPIQKTGKEVQCKNCGNAFYRQKNRINSQDNHFCSRECYLEDHAFKAIEVKCKTCGKTKTLDSTELCKYNKGQKDFYCNDKCRSKRDRVLTCIVCGVKFCAFEYRKSNNKKGFTVVRPARKTCSDKCVKENFRTNQDRKDKISKAFSGSNHPNYVNGVSYNGRVRKTDIKENFGILDKKEVFKKFKNKCFKCGSKENLSIDHHVPFSRGGLLIFSNCVLLCKSCNSSKNAKMPNDYYTKEEILKLEKLGVYENNLFNFTN